MSDVQWIDAQAVSSLHWSENMVNQRGWLEALATQPSASLVANIRTEIRLIQIGDERLPTTINADEYENSYVCSPYTTYVAYAKSELHKLNSPLLASILRVILVVLGMTVKAGRINRVVQLNNWLVSTNLYGPLRVDLIAETTRLVVSTYPTHCVQWRSLNLAQHADLIEHLLAAGYVLLPSRQVYLVDGERVDFIRKQNVKHDLNLLKRTTYQVIAHADFTEADYPRIVELYKALYLDKYSYFNPQFTEAFIRLCHQNGQMTLYGLRDESGILQGVIGYFVRGAVMTTPLVGYNIDLPQKHGLYRLLTVLVLRDANSRQLRMNMSSGVADFKCTRGAFPEIEFTAVYARHLSWARRCILGLLRGLVWSIGVPIMRAFKL